MLLLKLFIYLTLHRIVQLNSRQSWCNTDASWDLHKQGRGSATSLADKLDIFLWWSAEDELRRFTAWKKRQLYSQMERQNILYTDRRQQNKCFNIKNICWTCYRATSYSWFITLDGKWLLPFWAILVLWQPRGLYNKRPALTHSLSSRWTPCCGRPSTLSAFPLCQQLWS